MSECRAFPGLASNKDSSDYLCKVTAGRLRREHKKSRQLPLTAMDNLMVSVTSS